MVLTYLVSIDFLLDDVSLPPSAPNILTYIWFGIGGTLFLGHMICLIFKVIKYFRKSIRRPDHIIRVQDGHDYEPALLSMV
ncbi:hypothetical protein AB3S75_015902 [Citrus x aurantiifolia]